MLHGAVIFPVAFLASLVIATIASPAGVSGAVLLLPFQVSVLGTLSPSVTPTNLLYDVVATPGALYRYWRQGQTGGALTRQLLLGTLLGVVLGWVIRVELLPGPRAFDAIIAVVLILLGTSLVVRRSVTHPTGSASLLAIVPIAAIVGCVGGIYGIGGGSILAPILIAAGRPPSEVAPAALASTFLASVAGVVTFLTLAVGAHEAVAPDWSVGLVPGAGGILGAYCAPVSSRIFPTMRSGASSEASSPRSGPATPGSRLGDNRRSSSAPRWATAILGISRATLQR